MRTIVTWRFRWLIQLGRRLVLGRAIGTWLDFLNRSILTLRLLIVTISEAEGVVFGDWMWIDRCERLPLAFVAGRRRPLGRV